MGNTPVVAKQDIAKYVQDMAEIEAAEFTLRKAAEEMKFTANNLRTNAQKEYDNSIKQLEHEKNLLDSLYQKKKDFGTPPEVLTDLPPLHHYPPSQPEDYYKYKNEYKEKYMAGTLKLEKQSYHLTVADVFEWLLPLIPVLIAPVSIVCPILGILLYSFGMSVSAIIITLFILVVGTVILISYIGAKKTEEEICRDHNHAIEQTKKLIDDCIAYENYYKIKELHAKNNENIARAKKYQSILSDIKSTEDRIKKLEDKVILNDKNNNVAIQQSNLLLEQVHILIENADSLHNNKNKLYSINIIPPDYRELDCVLMFHQIFRNDLADTMREAVKIYEERVFRQEVIRGIDRIYSMLGRLASSMSSIENRLVQIRDEVKLMGNDVYQMSQSFANSQSAILSSIKQGQRETARYQDMSRSEQQRFQEQMLTETRASTYATEALKDATDKLVWYEQQKYWKNM